MEHERGAAGSLEDRPALGDRSLGSMRKRSSSMIAARCQGSISSPSAAACWRTASSRAQLRNGVAGQRLIETGHRGGGIGDGTGWLAPTSYRRHPQAAPSAASGPSRAGTSVSRLPLVADREDIDRVIDRLMAIEHDIAGISERYYQFAQLRGVRDRSAERGMNCKL